MIRNPGLQSLPPLVPTEDAREVQRLLGESRTKVVVLDDDPTGTQTVHGIDVLARWSVEELAGALSDPSPCFYVLSDTRGLPENEAAAVVGEISRNLATAGRITRTAFTVISRSDSTLRGHFAAELNALRSGLGLRFDATIVAPAFIEGGRLTIDAVHYVEREGRLVPVAETEFARDRTFGYPHSRLPEWIEERTRGAVRAGSVATVRLSDMRHIGGAASVRDRLCALQKGAFVAVDAAAYSDLETFVHGLLKAELTGRRYLCRTAASFVRVRAAIPPKPLLHPSEICDPSSSGGIVVVGSYIEATTVQLKALVSRANVTALEVDLDHLAARRSDVVDAVSAAATTAIRRGAHTVLFTSRKRDSASGPAGDLAAGARISATLAEILRSVACRPRFVIAKGGTTSSDLAILGLGMRRARVLGQAAPGVPVWEMGRETLWPGLKYVLWPGNVGGPSALADLVAQL